MNLEKVTSFYRSYAALWIFLFFSSGLLLGWQFLSRINLRIFIILILVLFTIVLLCYFFFRRWFVLFIFPLLVLLGMVYIYLSLGFFQPTDLRAISNKEITAFSGIIVDSNIRENGKNNYLLQVNWVVSDSTKQPARGKVYLYQGKSSLHLKYGDRLIIHSGIAYPPLPGNPGQFNFRRYLQLKGVYFQAFLNKTNCMLLSHDNGSFLQEKFFWPIRRRIFKITERYLPQPTRGVMQAIILGQKQNLERSVIKDFQRTGIVHILAISGLHVGFVLLILLMFFGLLHFPFRFKIFISLFCLFLFAALVDFKAPVVRASLMATFYFIARMFERRVKPLNIIAAAGLLILLIQPRQILQPGFQFSFAAVFGILYGYPRLQSYFLFKTGHSQLRRFIDKWLLQPALVSAAAILGTVPFTWYYFGSLQIGSVLVNIVLLPFVGLFVILSILFIALAFMGFGAVGGLAVVIHYLFLFILKVNSAFAALPFIQLYLPHPSVLSLSLLTLLIFLILNIKQRRHLIYLGLTLSILIFSFTGIFSKSLLKITFVNVGQGDGCIVQFPQGDVLIVDAGDRKFHFDAGRRDMLPVLRYYGIKHIKYLLGTHSHSDHIGGFITLLEKMKVDTLILTRYPAKTGLYHRLLETARNKGVPLIYKHRGQKLNVGSKCRVYILHPYGDFLKAKNYSGREVNNSSLVCKVVYGKISFMLTGDLERTAEAALFNYGNFLESRVLKVGHHGSKTSSSAAFLSLIKPQFSVVSVGRHNKFFHPSSKTMRRLRAMHTHPLRTDRVGAVVFESDGMAVRLLNWRK